MKRKHEIHFRKLWGKEKEVKKSNKLIEIKKKIKAKRIKRMTKNFR